MNNSQYVAFLNGMGNQEEGGVNWFDSGDSIAIIDGGSSGFTARSEVADHPAVEVSWYGAGAYCDWVGGELPSEAQWEYAARGPNGLRYPWGEDFDGERANYCDKKCVFDHKDEAYDDGYVETAPVGSYPEGASWSSALDMAGNVWDWISDWYAGDYYANSAAENPAGPESGGSKVLRGGSFGSGSLDLRSANRGNVDPATSSLIYGFRCVVPGG